MYVRSEARARKQLSIGTFPQLQSAPVSSFIIWSDVRVESTFCPTLGKQTTFPQNQTIYFFLMNPTTTSPFGNNVLVIANSPHTVNSGKYFLQKK